MCVCVCVGGGGWGGRGLYNWHDVFFSFINCIIYIQFSDWIICNYALFFGAYFSNATLSITESKLIALRVAGFMSDSERRLCHQN